MAASSPSLSNSTDLTHSPIPTSPAVGIAAGSNTNSSKNLRGLNKPKCIKCGNVARSRCPYQSCKSCCAKAQNPCHIHVLKGNSTFPDKAQSSSSPLFEQQSTEASPSGNSHRIASLRQLSNNFAQFNNLQSPVRSKKPMTKKEALAINEWRFTKLKEYNESNIEAENEGFDRYMQNVSFLEEVFSANSADEDPKKDGYPISNPNLSSEADLAEVAMAGMKTTKLRPNPVRTENFRKRIQYIVDEGLRKLRRVESNDGSSDLNEQDEPVKRRKKAKSWRAERVEALTDLIDKLNKARSEEDLKSCLEMKAQVFNWHSKTSQVESENIDTSNKQTIKVDSPPKGSNLSPPKWFSTTAVDQEALNRIEAHFSALGEIGNL